MAAYYVLARQTLHAVPPYLLTTSDPLMTWIWPSAAVNSLSTTSVAPEWISISREPLMMVQPLSIRALAMERTDAGSHSL